MILGWNLIKAAFLDSKTLDREVFVKPPQDERKDRYIKKLKKLLCGLDNAICQFWLKIKEKLVSMGLHIMP